jgi:predicted house-cleaning noncanonical NTP pyrophosphatase (MazG superfamily)
VRITYNKLVRDRIPEIIKAKGQYPVIRVLDEPAYQAALLDKLAEETQEVRAAPPDELAAELGDVLEVLQAIARAHDLTWDHVLAVAAKKRTTSGAFNHRLYLEHVEAPD